MLILKLLELSLPILVPANFTIHSLFFRSDLLDRAGMVNVKINHYGHRKEYQEEKNSYLLADFFLYRTSANWQ
jgi:hypothetical protein